jgi:hypothetical protein
MDPAFLTQLPQRTSAQLQAVLDHPGDYRAEVVEAVLAELDRRGEGPSEAARQAIRQQLEARDRAHASAWNALLGGTRALRRLRIRRITTGLLAVGLGTSALLYRVLPPAPANPLGYNPEDTKKYLRDLELYGGKVNVLATEAMRAWERLWQGRQLAVTLAWLTLGLALAFYLAATRLAPDPEA